MAMGQRGSAYDTTRPRQSNKPIFEDFQPIRETKEEEGAQIAVFRLPGNYSISLLQLCLNY